MRSNSSGVEAAEDLSVKILLFQRFGQGVHCLGGVLGLFVELDELAADDGASGIGLGSFEGLLVADAETDHAGMLEVHALDA